MRVKFRAKTLTDVEFLSGTKARVKVKHGKNMEAYVYIGEKRFIDCQVRYLRKNTYCLIEGMIVTNVCGESMFATINAVRSDIGNIYDTKTMEFIQIT